ncbi:MAG: 4-carboxymuconolactone decarboxylase [Pseudomonadota bacterium]
MADDSEVRFERGMATRRRVLGDAYVDGAVARTGALDAPFQRYITEGPWGSVWSRDGLSLRERSLVTLALLAGLGNWEEFALHLRATANTGASPEEVREAMLHVAVYAGAPAGNQAMKILKEIVAEREAGSADATG